MDPLDLLSAWSRPTSAIFSSRLLGSPPPEKRPNRVPPVPNAQLGMAIWNAINFSRIASVLFICEAAYPYDSLCLDMYC